MAKKPSIPKGTRDFNPQDVAKRNYIFNTIRQNFERFGFQPIETPSFENSETLMGKYGEEGDRLIFKILNSGDYLDKVDDDLKDYQTITSFFSKEFLTRFFETLKEKNFLSFSFTDKVGVFSLENQKDIYSSYIIFLSKEKSEILERSIISNKKHFLLKIINDIEFKFEESGKVDYNIIDMFSKFLKDISWLSDYNKYVARLLTQNKNDNFSVFISKEISEKALRYDLTVPFARYVVQHQNEIEFPFKRYQIQPVWRADRPQKGRFREFFQCDADVVGSQSLWQEVEFVQLYDAVFTALKLEGVTIKINNRKILAGIAEVIGAQDKLIDFTVALDKLDKIGEEKVKEEMLGKGIPEAGISKLQPLFTLSGSFESQIAQLKSILKSSAEGKKGIAELEFIDKAISELKLESASLQLDVTLARGLNYYTGAILEVAAPKSVAMGSIGGGGRYDDLTGIFGMKDVSGVGISFGLDRIYLVLEALNLFPETITNTIKALFINFGEAEAMASMKAIKELRKNGINAELFPDDKKTVRQFNYANKRNIPNVVLVGASELESGTYTLKNMETGDQKSVDLETLVEMLR